MSNVAGESRNSQADSMGNFRAPGTNTHGRQQEPGASRANGPGLGNCQDIDRDENRTRSAG